MDDLRIIQAWIIATIGGVVGLGFLYLRRRETGSAANLWAWAWLSFFGSLFASVIDGTAATLVAHALGTAFPILLLAGTLAYCGRAVPSWLIPVGFAVGALRGVLQLADLEVARTGLVLAVETSADFAAAFFLIRTFKGADRAPVVTALAVSLACFGILEMSNAYYLREGADISHLYVWLGSVATLMLGLTQILALLERAHDRHADDLGMLRRIAREAARAPDVGTLSSVSLEVVSDRLGLDAGGVWLRGRDPSIVQCVHFFGNRTPLPTEITRLSADRILPGRVLKSGEPAFVDDIATYRAETHPWQFEEGFRSSALIPLHVAGEAAGFVAVGRREFRPFDASERRVLAALTDELCLALGHVQAVQRLADERRVLASVIDSSPTGVLVANREARVEILNGTFAEHLGEGDATQWISKSIDSLAQQVAARFDEPEEFARSFGSDDAEPAFTISVTALQPVERDLLLFTGPIQDHRGEVIGRVWVSRDVSEERRLQEELRQSQKMETLGTLAGGVAHDFNNQLTAILGNARLLLASVGEDREAKESLIDIELAAEHCAELTRSLLAFARRAPLARRILDPRQIVEEASSLLRSLLPSTIDFDVRLPEAVGPVEADATQIQQILLNLVINARDALAGEGCIELSLAEREHVVTPTDEAHPGQYVVFSVADDGPGMDATTRERIFDPFFTTRGDHGGTGLGLAVVYGAARAHGGWVDVQSEPGAGSTFSVVLPVSDCAIQPSEASARFGSAADGEERRTVLLADDEAPVRRLARMTLERLGFRVLEAADGREAVSLFAARRDEVDVVLLDVTMPELDGFGALREIRSLEPTVPALLVSGLPAEDDAIPEGGPTSFLSKPYGLEELGREVRDLLEARGVPRPAAS